GQTIFEYERNCHGAEDYTKVAESIHNQFQTTPQLDTQPDAAEADEGRDEQALGQAEEPSAGEAAEDKNVQTAEQIQEESAVESVQEQDIPAPADAIQEPDAGAEHNHDQPPIEIKAIPQPDSEARPPELTQTTPSDPEQNQP
ncbi:MAG: hypothetical protein ACYTDW_20550, partial [Planctomycetota bacterium]